VAVAVVRITEERILLNQLLRHGFWKVDPCTGSCLRAGGGFGQQQRHCPTEAELVGIVLSVELHQKREHPVC
jgi:hypothetical protein